MISSTEKVQSGTRCIGLKSISYTLGELIPINEIDEIRDNRISQIQFRVRGLQTFSQAKQQIFDLALDCAKQTLEQSKVNIQDIGMVVFTTNSYRSAEFHNHDFGTHLLHELGLKQASFQGVFLQNCASLAIALRTARQFVITGEAKHVLVICADKVVEADYPRVVHPYIGIHSDGAASCLVTDEDPEYLLSSFSHLHDTEAWNVDYSTNHDAIQESFKVTSYQVVEDCLKKGSVSLNQLDAIISNNYNLPQCDVISRTWGLSENLFYVDNIPRIGHCLASDILINLRDGEDSGFFNDKKYMLLFFPAPHAWSAALLIKCKKDSEQREHTRRGREEK